MMAAGSGVPFVPRLVAVLCKGAERYIFIFDEAHRSEVLAAIERFAVDPQLSFTWHDAALLSSRIRNGARDVRINTEQAPP